MGNSNGLNGSGNGHDKEEEPSNVTRFPTEAERREMEKIRAANDAAERARKTKHEPVFNLPPVSKITCLVLILIQLVMTALDHFMPEMRDLIFLSGAFIPARYTGGMEFGWQAIISPVTHMLLHGGWLHLGMNVAMLAAFGSGFERDFGGKKLMIVLLVTGIAGALAHFAIYATAATPLIGASGGISGVIGVCILMMTDKSSQLQGMRISPWPFIAIWIGMAVFFGVFGMSGAEGEIAWTTHIGGFIAGLLLYKPIMKLKI
ncbi:MAG: rhomboid family intramembrane serine protease [Alphaproteobacteria bacterium]